MGTGWRTGNRAPDPVLLNLISFQFKGGEMQTLFFSLFLLSKNPSGESQYSCLTPSGACKAKSMNSLPCKLLVLRRRRRFPGGPHGPRSETGAVLPSGRASERVCPCHSDLHPHHICPFLLGLATVPSTLCGSLPDHPAMLSSRSGGCSPRATGTPSSVGPAFWAPSQQVPDPCPIGSVSDASLICGPSVPDPCASPAL